MTHPWRPFPMRPREKRTPGRHGACRAFASKRSPTSYAGLITSSLIRLSSRLHEPSVQFSIWARAWMMVPL